MKIWQNFLKHNKLKHRLPKSFYWKGINLKKINFETNFFLLL